MNEQANVQTQVNNGNAQAQQMPMMQQATAMPMQQSTPFYKKWWFWAGVGAIVVVGGAIALSKLGADEVAGMAVDAATNV